MTGPRRLAGEALGSAGTSLSRIGSRLQRLSCAIRGDAGIGSTDGGERELEGLQSLALTLHGIQERYDEGRLDEEGLVDEIMHLDIDAESYPGELREARERAARLEMELLVSEARSPETTPPPADAT